MVGGGFYAQSQELRARVMEFYRVYFSVLRAELARPDVSSEAIPDFLKGYKRVIAMAGSDGVVVAHFPIEHEIEVRDSAGVSLMNYPSMPDAEQDIYEFGTFPNSPVKDIVTLMSGGIELDLEVTPGVPWGVRGFSAPQQRVDDATGELAWQAPWTRLVAADLNSLEYWEDPETARAEAREDVELYIQQ